MRGFFNMLDKKKLIIFILAVYCSNLIFAQTTIPKNEWIDYNKTYVRIGVMKSGIQRLQIASLPDFFSKQDPNKFQLWHRGKEVAIIKSTTTEVLFYGEKNDGASDTLVYRPYSARLNPYVNLFSEEGAYFLTVSEQAKRVKVIDGSQLSGAAEPFHYQSDVVFFANQFAFSTFGPSKILNNSFYDEYNSWTGTTVYGPDALAPGVKETEVLKEFKLKNWVSDQNGKASLEIMVNGLYEGQHDIQVYTGKSNQLDKVVSSIKFAGFGGRKTNIILDQDDVNDLGLGYFKLKSISTSLSDWYGLTYYKLVYPQRTDLSGLNEGLFTFKQTLKSNFRISVEGSSNDCELFDISDSFNPRLIKGVLRGNILEAMIEKGAQTESKVLVVRPAAYIDISKTQVYEVDFKPIFAKPQLQSGVQLDPASYDYFIITTTALAEGTKAYAQYRASLEGGGHKVLVINIRSVYDQFNYGDPSPVGIRNFVQFMLSKGIREDKHNLLLVGPSVTYPARLVKEMPGEVPTFGDPGSDILLVAGINGVNQDVPAIPVGRINAISPADIGNYLDKVKAYEHSADFGWRKNVLHLNGGHSVSEINQLKTILTELEPTVERGVLGGRVSPFVKQNPGEVEKVDISKELNNGVGMITYFGHGSQTVTDLDMGYATDATRKYNNLNKYPLMYFNGCGVGNIFTSRLTHLLSGNWVLSPNKGAVGIIANSYDSYVSSSQKHLKVMYDKMFVESPHSTIGQIIKMVAQEIVMKGANSYDIANLHQFYLHGDPVLKLINVDRPDYALVPDESVFLASESPNKKIGESVDLKLKVVLSNFGKYDKGKQIPLSVKYVYLNGSEVNIVEKTDAVSFKDTVSLDVQNKSSLRSIEIRIDEANTINELNKANNYGELVIDWEVAKQLNVYPAERVKDAISPQLKVLFDGRQIVNGETLKENPKIEFNILDDRIISLADSSLLNIYLRDCYDDNCTYQRISFRDDQFTFDHISGRLVKITYFPTNLTYGDYELLALAEDNSGNSNAESYKIRFKIGELGKNVWDVKISPNPASDYVKFTMENLESLESINWIIYNSQGKIVIDETIVHPNDGNFEWYWFPQNLSGLYVFKVITSNISGIQNTKSGKLLLIK
jgi:hypothetical protein